MTAADYNVLASNVQFGSNGFATLFGTNGKIESADTATRVLAALNCYASMPALHTKDSIANLIKVVTVL